MVFLRPRWSMTPPCEANKRLHRGDVSFLGSSVDIGQRPRASGSAQKVYIAKTFGFPRPWASLVDDWFPASLFVFGDPVHHRMPQTICIVETLGFPRPRCFPASSCVIGMWAFFSNKFTSRRRLDSKKFTSRRRLVSRVRVRHGM